MSRTFVETVSVDALRARLRGHFGEVSAATGVRAFHLGRWMVLSHGLTSRASLSRPLIWLQLKGDAQTTRVVMRALIHPWGLLIGVLFGVMLPLLMRDPEWPQPMGGWIAGHPLVVLASVLSLQLSFGLFFRSRYLSEDLARTEAIVRAHAEVVRSDPKSGYRP